MEKKTMTLQNPSRCTFLKKTQIFIVTNSTQGND